MNLVGREVYQVSLGFSRKFRVTKHYQNSFGSWTVEGVDNILRDPIRLPAELVCVDRREAIQAAYNKADGYRLAAEQWEREENEEETVKESLTVGAAP
jgi:hypothetical protein